MLNKSYNFQCLSRLPDGKREALRVFRAGIPTEAETGQIRPTTGTDSQRIPDLH